MSTDFKSLQTENRVFPPSAEFKAKARISSMEEYQKLHAESINSPDKFWAREAAELHWQKKWTKVLDWKPPFAKWFVGGKLNVCENCLDRHLANAAQEQGGDHLGRRARRHPHAHLPAASARGLPVRQRAQGHRA